MGSVEAKPLATNHTNHSTNKTKPTYRSALAAELSLMLAATALLLWKLIAVLLVVIAVLDLITMSRERRIKLYSHQGHSQQSIADRLGISRYQVRKALSL
jgi:hypothetical protein